MINRSSALLPLGYCVSVVVAAAILTTTSGASSLQRRFGPRAILQHAEPLAFPGATDSNSPLVWDRIDGEQVLTLFNSVNGHPWRSQARHFPEFTAAEPVGFERGTPGGIWMEAVVADEASGSWYGYYHNEVAGLMCPDSGRVLPRIGAARSTDFGSTWQDLGIVLEAPHGTEVCETTNTYFVGGAGDLSVMLDRDGMYLYVFYSQYPRDIGAQGVAVARMPWADRDAPAGTLSVWRDDAWIPIAATDAEHAGDTPAATQALGSPLFRTNASWHAADGRVDAFWGPSIHWNTYLARYVMLLNRGADGAFAQRGIYVSYSRTLAHPLAWTTPVQLLEGGRWYPQVVGLEPGSGSDKAAGRIARFFMRGTSEHLVTFLR